MSTNFYTRDLVGVGLTSNFAVDRWPAQDQPEKRLHSRSAPCPPAFEVATVCVLFSGLESLVGRFYAGNLKPRLR